MIANLHLISLLDRDRMKLSQSVYDRINMVTAFECVWVRLETTTSTEFS